MIVRGKKVGRASAALLVRTKRLGTLRGESIWGMASHPVGRDIDRGDGGKKKLAVLAVATDVL